MQVATVNAHPAPLRGQRRPGRRCRWSSPTRSAPTCGSGTALLPLLPAGLRMLRYDMRGHGLTDAPAGDYCMGDLVADAAGADGRARASRARSSSASRSAAWSPRGSRPSGPTWCAPRCSRTPPPRSAPRRAGASGSPRSAPAASTRSPTASWSAGSRRRFRAERADELAGWRHMLTRTPVDGYLGCCAAMSRHRPARVDRRPAPAGPGHRRRRRRLDAAGPGARDGREHPRRALRDHPRRRPHPLRRAARGAGRG